MNWFKFKPRQEIKDLKAEVEMLRGMIEHRTEIPIGKYTPYALSDKADVSLVLALILDHLNLEVKRSPARMTIEPRPSPDNINKSAS